jgi:hypothetical protein
MTELGYLFGGKWRVSGPIAACWEIDGGFDLFVLFGCSQELVFSRADFWFPLLNPDRALLKQMEASRKERSDLDPKAMNSLKSEIWKNSLLHKYSGDH